MSVRAVTSNHVPRWNLSEISRHFERPAISMSSQGTLHVYKPPSGGEYVVKFRPEAPKVEREISFLDGAGELAVDVISRIYDDLDRLVGFGMPRLCPIDPEKLTLEQKYVIFNQIRQIIPKLHDRGIIHGDIKLSNVLLDTPGSTGQVVKLCDFGASAWMEEEFYPRAFTLQWCSPYRLDSAKRHRLVPEEDIYAGGITVWELFTGETPFRDIDPDDDVADLEGQIRGGLSGSSEIHRRLSGGNAEME